MTQAAEDDGRAHRVRRQRRTTVVIVLVLLTLAGAFYYASSYFRDTTPQPGPCTTEVAAAALKPADVSINVYNSTMRRGLAAAVAKSATTRGFSVKSIGNDPKSANVKKVAQIRYGPQGVASARLLKLHVPGAVYVNDKRTNDTVDLVVGAAWKSFGPVPAAPIPTQTLRPCPTVTVTP